MLTEILGGAILLVAAVCKLNKSGSNYTSSDLTRTASSMAHDYQKKVESDKQNTAKRVLRNKTDEEIEFIRNNSELNSSMKSLVNQEAKRRNL